MQEHACGHHHDQDSGLPVGERLRQAEILCTGRGTRLTAQRRVVLEALLTARRALGAYDLIEQVSRATGKRTAPITIYRALEFLQEMGLAHRIESRNAFLACHGGHRPHALTVFMICDCCGQVAEADAPGLEAELDRLATGHGFRAQSRVIEMAGRCSTCNEGP